MKGIIVLKIRCNHITYTWRVSVAMYLNISSHRDVSLITPELCELYGRNTRETRHLEGPAVLHHKLDQALAGADVRHCVLL